MHGNGILAVEVTNVSQQGLWVFIQNREYFLEYTLYPWFRNATIAQIMNVELLHDIHLYWPDLDVDLEIQSLENPQEYPLISKFQAAD